MTQVRFLSWLVVLALTLHVGLAAQGNLSEQDRKEILAPAS